MNMNEVNQRSNVKFILTLMCIRALFWRGSRLGNPEAHP